VERGRRQNSERRALRTEQFHIKGILKTGVKEHRYFPLLTLTFSDSDSPGSTNLCDIYLASIEQSATRPLPYYVRPFVALNFQRLEEVSWSISII